MTDDRGAGEEIYKHSTYCHATYEFSKCLGCAFAAGRKAERERCLKIVNDFCQCHDDIVQIEKRIAGGQDGN
jgi:cytochrome c